MKKEREIIIRTYAIDRPEEISKMAKILKEYIIKNELSVKILGKDYVLVEGWQFGGNLLGLFPKIVKVEKVGENKWLAQAEITGKDGKVLATGYALCSKEEAKKKSFDEYAILSMAQTRAIGKAYRNLIGWVVKMSGYESLPAEEADQIITETKTKKEKKITKESISEAVKKIRETEDVDALKEWQVLIKESSLYDENQKRVISQAITETLSKLSGENGKSN